MKPLGKGIDAPVVPDTHRPATSLARITVRDLRVSFGETTVLDGVNLDVSAGENLVLIGTSGSGKTVLLRCIIGLLQPDSGSIQIDGQETTKLGARARDALMSRVGVLFQRNALFDSLMVWENVVFGLMQRGQMARASARALAIEKLAEVGLDETAADLLPADLSGGMQKRVALARALAANPEFLFLDDPVAGLDPMLTNEMDDLIAGRFRTLGTTGLSITQDVGSVRRIANRVAMLWQGRIVWTGPADQLDVSGNPFVDQFVHGRVSGPIRFDQQWTLPTQS